MQAKTVPFSPCPACEANASSHKHTERNHTAMIFNTIKRRRARSEGRRNREIRNESEAYSNDLYRAYKTKKGNSHEEFLDSEEEDISTSVQSNRPLQRRLSAPEIAESSVAVISTAGGTC